MPKKEYADIYLIYKRIFPKYYDNYDIVQSLNSLPNNALLTNKSSSTSHTNSFIENENEQFINL